MKYVIPDAKAEAWRPILQTQGAVRRLKASSKNRGLMVYPNILSDSPDYLRMMADLAMQLSALPVDTNCRQHADSG